MFREGILWSKTPSTTSPVKNFPLRPVLLAAASLCCLLPLRAHAQAASQLYADAVQTLKTGDVADAKHKLQLALEIDKNFLPASALLSRIISDQRTNGANAPGVSVRTLEKTIVPVEFKEPTLTSALEFLRQRADEMTGGKVKINFAVNLPPELANKRVTLKLDRVPIMEVLKYIGEFTGVSFQVQPYAILVTPATTLPVPPAASPTP